MICDYDKIFDIVEKKKSLFRPSTEIQKKMGRIAVVADGAHAFGATKNGKHSGEIADFTSFSFHAVKNLTTAEGGAAVWRDIDGIDNEKFTNSLCFFLCMVSLKMLWLRHSWERGSMTLLRRIINAI